MDASQINNQLWCGAAIQTVDDIAEMLADGITADIDCRAEYNEAPLLAGHPSIAYLYAGVPDDGVPKPVSWFAAGWGFAKPILQAGGVVLAHCAAGVNRGPSMAYFLLRAQWKTPPDTAFGLIKQARPIVNVAYRADADRAITALGL